MKVKRACAASTDTSFRVLYDLAGGIARDDQQRMQVYFYDAYGKVLSLGGSIIASNALPLANKMRVKRKECRNRK